MKAQFLCAVLLIAALPAVSYGQFHGDIRPYNSNGRITTGEYVDATGDFTPDVRVFGYDFQEDPVDPYYINDPGFNAAIGSGLPGGSALSFNILTSGESSSGQLFSLPAQLSFWNGIGDVNFGTTAGESLTFSLGSRSQTAGAGSSDIAGFNLLNALPANGYVHTHLASELKEIGSSLPSDGIYLVALELAAGGLEDSLPFFLVFNNGLSEEQHDAAIDYVQSNFATAAVPEPSSIVLFASGAIGLFFAVRRRRSQLTARAALV